VHNKTGYALLGWDDLDTWAAHNDGTWNLTARIGEFRGLNAIEKLRLLAAAMLEDKIRFHDTPEEAKQRVEAMLDFSHDDGEWMDNMTDIIAIAVAACLAVRKENNER